MKFNPSRGFLQHENLNREDLRGDASLSHTDKNNQMG